MLKFFIGTHERYFRRAKRSHIIDRSLLKDLEVANQRTQSKDEQACNVRSCAKSRSFKIRTPHQYMRIHTHTHTHNRVRARGLSEMNSDALEMVGTGGGRKDSKLSPEANANNVHTRALNKET